MNPGFSERTFEFCFNAEFCHRFDGLLASHPHIPSQRMEKDLGYDVEFEIQHGQFTTSVFFQHKVSCYAESKAGRNARFFDTHGGPYFRFSVDNDQHNTLCELSRTKGNAYYCAPRFHLSHDLESYFRANSIGDNAILLDPLQIGLIHDAERHNITYDPNGSSPMLHSEPKRFKKAYSGGKEGAPEFHRRTIDNNYIGELSEHLWTHTLKSNYARFLTKEIEALRLVERIQYLLGRVYQVSWVLLP